jgi:hypothetical protein
MNQKGLKKAGKIKKIARHPILSDAVEAIHRSAHQRVGMPGTMYVPSISLGGKTQIQLWITSTMNKIPSSASEGNKIY